MPRPFFLRRAGWALVLGLLVAAAADAQPTDWARPDAAARIERAASVLDLTAAQRGDLAAIVARHAEASPGASWQAAAEIADLLTDAQIATLRERVEARRGDGQHDDRREARSDRERPRAGTRGQRARRARAAQRDGQARPTDDQRDALRAIAEAVRPEAEALVERFRSGALSDAAFVAEVRALRERTTARVRAALPAEQADRLAERAERQRAAEAAREDALNLTAAQKAALQALALDRLREAPERPDLRPYLDADGRLDRAAYREAMRERREASRADRGARRQRANEILTAEQEAVLLVHRALLGGRGREARGPRSGRGQGDPVGRMLGPIGRVR